MIVFNQQKQYQKGVSLMNIITYGCKYYQITAIDEFSRKRVLKIVKDKFSACYGTTSNANKKNTTVFSMAKWKSGKKP